MDISSSDPVPATEQFRRVSGQGGGLLGGRLAIDAPAVILPVVFGSLTAWAPDDLGARPSGPPKRRCRRRQPCRRLGQRVEPTTIWSSRSSSFAAIATVESPFSRSATATTTAVAGNALKRIGEAI